MEKFHPMYCHVVQERHQDLGLHLHGWCDWGRYKDTSNPRIFDVCDTENEDKVYHPNLKAIRYLEGWKTYIKKDIIDEWKSGVEQLDLDWVPLCKKRKTYEDFVWYQNHEERCKRTSLEWPFTLLTDVIIQEPSPESKQRHWWIQAPPGFGKTPAVQDMADGKQVFFRGSTAYPFEDYQEEQLVVYDDVIPGFEEVISVSNTYKGWNRIFGGCRYNTKYWPIKKTRTIIVLNNRSISEVYYELPAQQMEAIKARFIEIQKQ